MKLRYLRRREVIELIGLTAFFVIGCAVLGWMVVADLMR
jgi:hypothetical protein